MIRIMFVNETDYRDVAFTRTSEHVVTLRGDVLLLNNPNTAGFYTYKKSADVLLGDFTKYTTVYRIADDFIQYSDDGSVWEAPPEPTRDIVISVQWDDTANADGVRPNSVTVTIDNTDELVFTEENDWRVVVSKVPTSRNVTITAAEAVEDYTTTICGTSVIYHHEYVDPTPSLEERVTDVEDAIIELYDLILMAEEE